MKKNGIYVVALTLGLAVPALPAMAQQSGTYQGQDTARPQDRSDQNQQRPWSEDQSQGTMQGQDRDRGTYSNSQTGQYGQDRNDQDRQNQGTYGNDQDQRDHDQNGTWQGSDKDRSNKDRDDQNKRGDDQGWNKDRDNDHSRVSSDQDYTNSKFYKLGYQDGMHDRDKNSRRDHNRNFKNDDDRRAYESGYDAAFGRQH